MAQTLTAFVEEMRQDLAIFEQAYHEAHRKNPVQYPLEMVDGQEGLWFEFFSDHVTNNRSDG